MKKFLYKAIKNRKEMVSGYVEAASLADAADKVRNLGFLPSSIYEEKSAEVRTEKNKKIRKLPLKDLILFTSTLQTYIESEIPILNALDNISKQTDRKNIKNLADKLLSGIKNGQSLSQAIDENSEAVGEAYAALCKAGEESGTLSSTFGYLSVLLKKQDDLRSKYIRILAYPAIVITIITVLFFVLGGFVLPVFIGLFPSPDDITGTIKFVMFLYNFILNCWWIFLIAGVFLLYSWTDISLRKKLKGLVENILINIPIIKNCMRYMSLSHYMNVLYFSYEAGLPIVDAMKLAENTIVNKPINKKAKVATSIVLHNKPVSEAYYETDLIPSEFMPIIGAGEEAGRLGQAFRDVAIAITNKLDLSIDIATKAMEPVLMSIVGIFAAIIVVSLLQAYLAACQF